MLKHLVNECRLLLSISVDGPVLIKSGLSQIDRTDMTFVRSLRGGTEQVFLPGSSLKGVIRSHAERIGNTLKKDVICNPFNIPREKKENPSPYGKKSCSYMVKSTQPKPYAHSCPACKLFGSLAMGGRFNVEDAYEDSDRPARIEYRDGVGIDRFSGGVADTAKFEYEVATEGTFQTRITVRNFELWQLSWLWLVLRDLAEGLLPIGMGSSRGLGRVTADICALEVDVLSLETPTEVHGLGSHFRHDAKTREAYGIRNEVPRALPEGAVFQPHGPLRKRLHVTGSALSTFLDDLGPLFAAYLDQNGASGARQNPREGV